MRKRVYLLFLLAGVILISATCFMGTGKTENLDEFSNLVTDKLCTAFCVDNGDDCFFGTNLDHGTLKVGQIYVNKRNVLKTGWEASTSGEYAQWISKYGSVTLNIVANQIVWGGMNEAGLMISTMSLLETEQPPPDERPPLTSGLWVQYLLDNFATVEEVIASDELVRSVEQMGHYLVCDGKGDCAVIEFLDGKMVAYTGENLPVKALANSTYQDSLIALEDGNYWKVKVRGVDPEGPAAEAGILENDWITSVNGTELVGQDSLTTFFEILTQHESGDILDLALIHPGETEPVNVELVLSPLPEDMSRYVFPPAVPKQVLSLGFFPLYTGGDFLIRFVSAANSVQAFEPATTEKAIAYVFDGLEAVSREDTVWSAVFDPQNMQIYFHTSLNPNIRSLDFDDLDFSCKTPPMVMDVHYGEAGDISSDLVEYTYELGVGHTLPILPEIWQTDISSFFVEVLFTGFDSFPCMEDNPDAIKSPDKYIEDHRPLIPPYVVWFASLMVKRYGLIWLGLVLVSLVFIIWRLGKKQHLAARGKTGWIILVVVLGPVGVVIYLAIMRKNKRVGQQVGT